MTDRSSPVIVVGYDDSPSARAALGLAVDRVGDGKLYVVHGYSAPADYCGAVEYDAILHAALAHGESVLEHAAAAEPRLASVDHETELIPGRPAEVIANVAETRGADEIIIGTRGFGRLHGVFGSVAHALLHEAKCPVTIIPDAALAQLGETGGQSSPEVRV